MSTSSILKIQASAAGTTSWYKLPSQSSSSDVTVFTGVQTSGDTVIIEVSNDDSITSADNLTSTTASTQIAQSNSQSATTFSGAILGVWKWVRLNKTGTAGTTTVQIR